jgi:arylsulfatase A-like enzyme
VKGGRIDRSLTASVDFGRTILGWGNALEYKQTLDGVDLAPLLENRASKVRDSIYGEIGMSRAVRKGKWKYIALRESDYLKNLPLEMRQARLDACRDRMLMQGRQPFPNKATDPFAHIGWLPGGWDNTWSAMKEHPHYFDVDQLYNLEEDPNEKVNLAGDPQYAGILEEMKHELGNYLSTLPGQFGEFQSHCTATVN